MLNLRLTISITIFFLLILLIDISVFAEQSGLNQENVEVHYTDSAIQLDGILNEAVWKDAQTISDLTQRELVEGAEPTEKTEIKLLYDTENFYMGVICYDSEPDKIIHKQLKFDTDPGSDDRISFIIDTYHDMRMGYLFSVNPNGMRYDATFLTGTDGENVEWDGIWDVRARIMNYGWSCEIVIPFKTLRFPVKDVQLWGFNIKRTIRRKNEEIHWHGWKRNDNFFDLSKCGTLRIDKSLKSGRELEIKPFTLAGMEKEISKNTNDTFNYGFDIKYGLSSNTTLDLTTKTDFAQVESDKEEINLTRFDLFYPEKRDFFLEGFETFDFTQGGTRLFYSRRIGISPDREEIPILGGAKLTQKKGSYRLGFLTMQTEDAHGYPTTNYSAVRVKKDVLQQSYIGFIATSVADSKKHDNQVYGLDFRYRTDTFLRNKNFEVQGYLSGSVTDGESNDNLAGRIYANYPNDFLSAYMLYHVIDNNFNPEIGYVKRTGIKNYILSTVVTPRPDIPHIKKILFEPLYINYTTDMNGKLLSRIVEFKPFGLLSNSGDKLEFYYKNEYDYVEDDFTVFSDINIAHGVYDWWYYEIQFDTSPSRYIFLDMTAQWGDFYNGKKQLYDLECTLKTNRYYSLSAYVQENRIVFNGKNFYPREYGGKLGVDFSTRLSTSTFLQWNNETNEVNINFRIHYIPKIGSDLYIVYNHLMDEERNYDSLYRTCILKLDYTYRF